MGSRGAYGKARGQIHCGCKTTQVLKSCMQWFRVCPDAVHTLPCPSSNRLQISYNVHYNINTNCYAMLTRE